MKINIYGTGCHWERGDSFQQHDQPKQIVTESKFNDYMIVYKNTWYVRLAMLLKII